MHVRFIYMCLSSVGGRCQRQTEEAGPTLSLKLFYTSTQHLRPGCLCGSQKQRIDPGKRKSICGYICSEFKGICSRGSESLLCLLRLSLGNQVWWYEDVGLEDLSWYKCATTPSPRSVRRVEEKEAFKCRVKIKFAENSCKFYSSYERNLIKVF